MLKTIIKNMIPLGIMEHYRRVRLLQSYGFPHKLTSSYSQTLRMQVSLDQSNYMLWPAALKREPYDWALVDVGANEGQFVQAALILSQPKEVFVFEPSPACQPMLIEKLGKVKTCHIIEKAVGSHAGVLDLHCTTDSKFSSVLRPLPKLSNFYPLQVAHVTHTIRVPVVTLDETLADLERIGLLKLDVQGFELDVLQGAIEILNRTTAVLLEANYIPHYQRAAEFDQNYQFLVNRGFSLAGVSAPFIANHVPLWADAMFVRKSILDNVMN